MLIYARFFPLITFLLLPQLLAEFVVTILHKCSHSHTNTVDNQHYRLRLSSTVTLNPDIFRCARTVLWLNNQSRLIIKRVPVAGEKGCTLTDGDLSFTSCSS